MLTNSELLKMLRSPRQARNLNELHEVASEFLSVLDQLNFHDDVWFQEVVRHISTLDSAASFESDDEAELEQVWAIVRTAFIEIDRLAAEKA